MGYWFLVAFPRSVSDCLFAAVGFGYQDGLLGLRIPMIKPIKGRFSVLQDFILVVHASATYERDSETAHCDMSNFAKGEGRPKRLKCPVPFLESREAYKNIPLCFIEYCIIAYSISCKVFLYFI